MKARHHAKHLVKGLSLGLLLAAVIIGGALGIFLAIYGPDRFLADFWPLDNSRVGPNLCASIVLTVLVIGHNEYRTALKAAEKGDNIRQLTRELEGEVLHPAETAEEHIADDVKENA